MKWYSNSKKLPDAWVDVPDVWEAGDWAIYYDAHVEAEEKKLSDSLHQLAGVVALIRAGRVKTNIPDLIAESMDITHVGLLELNFLTTYVASSLEVTQRIPFGSLAPPGTGTAEIEKNNGNREPAETSDSTSS